MLSRFSSTAEKKFIRGCFNMKINEKILKNNIEKRMASDLEACNIGGAVCRVEQNGKVMFSGAFGVKTPGDDTPLCENAIFRLASMTKPITATATMILVDRGIIRLDDRVSKYLPDFAEMRVAEYDENGNFSGSRRANTAITVRHLLTHSSGIGTGRTSLLPDGGQKAESMPTLSEAVDEYSRSLLDFEPGTKSDYSPLGAFDVLARIIEIASETELEAFFKKEIFGPCKMCDTTFTPSHEQWGRAIAMHNKTDGKSVVGYTAKDCVFWSVPTTHTLGGAGLVSTIADYRNFATMLLSGEIFGKRILSENAICEMSRRQLSESVNTSFDVWGLGVRVVADESYRRLPVGSFGWSGAFGTHFWVDRKNMITAIYMKNSLYDGGSGAVTAANFESDVTASLE